MWTIRIMPAKYDGPPHLWRTSASVTNLVRTNDRLMTCFAVAAGVMSEGQACAHLGLDRVTFREIFAAAEAWAAEAERNLDAEHDKRRHEAAAEPDGAGPSESPPTGVAGTSGGVGESGGVPEPGDAPA